VNEQKMSAIERTLLPDVMPMVHRLSRADKLHLIQLLAGELAQKEGKPLLEAGASYPVWTPLNAEDGAAVLLRELERAAK
jgi:hypothetical protein